MLLDIKPATLTHDGVEYTAELGTIKHTMLGKEDHGIFTFLLELDFGGHVQGAGTHGLNDPTNFGNFIQGILNFFGGNWEDLKGRRVFALREGGMHGLIRGLMDAEQTKVLIFSELAK